MPEIFPTEKNHSHKLTDLNKHLKKQFLLMLTVLVLCAGDVFAQDPHFSQYFVSPLTLNPAYTGKFNGTFRFAGNFKKQWPTINNAFTTSTASYDFSILNTKLPENDTWGLGFLAVNDQSGNKILNNSFYSISTAYSKSLDDDGKNQITIGFQGTMANKRLDVRRADFQDELTALGFTGVTSEVLGNNPFSIQYFDLSTGVMYALSTDGDNSFYLGASIYHVNRPSESFMGGYYQLNARSTIHGGAYLPMGENKSLHASFIHQRQGAAFETLAGASFAYNVSYDENNPLQLYAGGWYRLGDALIPYLGVEVNGFRFGFSYDINHSTLRPASVSRGGSELSIIYIGKYKDPLRKKINCPKF